MPNKKPRWLKINSPISKQLDNAQRLGYMRGARELADMLCEDSAISESYISFLLEQELERKNNEKPQ